ncbi:MAG TPA: hypothetical protein IGP91_09285 [Thermosynechococcus sp. M46_R2017_013]|nr:hypothetical protein [Thermosynechococcus sp. M46_R2017_013]
MTQSDDPKRTDPYILETCLTDAQANRVLDEVFAAMEAELNESEPLSAVLENLSPLLVPFEATTPPSPTTEERSRWLHCPEPRQAFSWGDRFLMGVGIASFVLGVGLWINLNRQPVAVTPEAVVATAPSPADVAFAEYLQNSLQLLSQQAATPTPAPPAIAGNSVSTPTASTPTVERIYVPVYQAPAAPTVTLPNLPTVTAPTPAATPAPPPPPPSSRASPTYLGGHTRTGRSLGGSLSKQWSNPAFRHRRYNWQRGLATGANSKPASRAAPSRGSALSHRWPKLLEKGQA